MAQRWEGSGFVADALLDDPVALREVLAQFAPAGAAAVVVDGWELQDRLGNDCQVPIAVWGTAVPGEDA